MKHKKSLGQHFLCDARFARLAVEAAGLRAGERVLEIGPGGGMLTRELLATGARVMAVECDEALAAALSASPALRSLPPEAAGHLTVVAGDILAWDPASAGFASGEWSVVANIPYYITGAILEHLLAAANQPRTMVLMVQREVAERVVAADSKQSILSISVQVFGTPRIVAFVPPEAFDPAPAVESALLAISDISNAFFQTNHLDEAAFFALVRRGFAHKRKLLRSNLGLPSGELARHGISELARAEDLSTHEWAILSGTLEHA